MLKPLETISLSATMILLALMLCMTAAAVDCRRGSLDPQGWVCQANDWLIARQR